MGVDGMRGFGIVLMILGVITGLCGLLDLVVGEGTAQAVIAASLFVGGAVFVGSGEIVDGLRLAREAFARRAPALEPAPDAGEPADFEPAPRAEPSHPLRRPGYHRSRAA